MDEIRARRMAEELLGKSIGKWEINEYCGSGKSALVLKGKWSGHHCAVKVFDPELVQRFGKEVQLKRIKRELMLRDKYHENLVRIIDGGECSATELLYVVMEHLEVPTLESVIKDIPRCDIPQIISQVASAAQYLESLGLCHRDIKPSNIVITPDYQKATLLDLGVLRPIGDSDLTDTEARHFIGTLRYSSPEFLMRTEDDSIDGWQAVTFYQLGAVLHDLIMKKPLFDEHSNPYAKLVEAVMKVTPIIQANYVDPNLIHLAKTCLIKDPNVRLRFISWESFSLIGQSSQPIEAVKKRIHQRYIATQSEYIPSLEEEREARHRNRILSQMVDKIEAIIRKECAGTQAFPPMEVKKSAVDINKSNQIVITFPTSLVHQLPLSLFLILSITLMDVATEAISLSYWCAVGNEEVDMEQIPRESFHLLFTGAYQESIVKDRVEMFLYLSLDAGQQVGNKRDTELIPLGPFEGIRS